ncbi:MAG: glycosyltransferase family 2 protein [Gemmatimonadaceae bacterium]
MIAATALLAALPWALAPLVVLARARRSRALSDWADVVPPPAPRVSVVIPARNEARNIERCARSVLASAYPELEVIVVDDHSTDGTGGIARAMAERDPRLRVITPDALPADWFGKQWACAAGAAVATGEVLLFTDADTEHAPDLIPRAVNAMRDRGADLLSVAGAQEMGTFWERVIQPQLFVMLLARYGSTERVSASTRPSEVIANGQCIFVRRDAYDAMGGHGAVRHKVAEDLALAQRFVARGRRIALVTGLDQLSTRMYTSLGEIVRGWEKNVYVGGRDAAPFGAWGRAVYPALLLAVPLFGLAPPVALVVGLAGLVSANAVVWALVCVACTMMWWGGFYRIAGLPLWYGAVYPLGLALVLYIMGAALARGRRVTWKGRTYLAR